MALPIVLERRKVQRKLLTGLWPGAISWRKDATGPVVPLVCKPVDISKQGLGILSAQALGVGTQIVLDIPKTSQKIWFQVAWVKVDMGKHNKFRFGLEVVEGPEDLEEVFVQSGCLV